MSRVASRVVNLPNAARMAEPTGLRLLGPGGNSRYVMILALVRENPIDDRKLGETDAVDAAGPALSLTITTICLLSKVCCTRFVEGEFDSSRGCRWQSCVPTNSSSKQMTLPNLKFFHLKKACEAAVHRVVVFISDHHNPLNWIPQNWVPQTRLRDHSLALGKL